MAARKTRSLVKCNKVKKTNGTRTISIAYQKKRKKWPETTHTFLSNSKQANATTIRSRKRTLHSKPIKIHWNPLYLGCSNWSLSYTHVKSNWKAKTMNWIWTRRLWWLFWIVWRRKGDWIEQLSDYPVMTTIDTRIIYFDFIYEINNRADWWKFLVGFGLN